MVEDLLDGKLTGKPEGVTKLEVSIKKINNRKIISVIEDMLNSGLILFLDRKFIIVGAPAVNP
jgi:hypothetical protein